jgi:hypothetical protein
MVSSRATWAGEFGVDPSWHRLIAASTSISAPRWCHDPSCAARLLTTPTVEHRVDGLSLPMQYRNRADHVHATALVGKLNGLQPVSSKASLNHPVNHSHIAAGRCITFDTIRPSVTAPHREGTRGQTAMEPKSPDQQQFSSPQKRWPPTQATPHP